MHFSPAFVLAALPFLGLTSATAIHRPRRTTSVDLTKRSRLSHGGTVDLLALQNHVAHVKSKIHRGLLAFEANTGARHPLASLDVSLSTRASAELTDADEQLWFGTIEVGSPPVKYTVDFDTGSSDLFLPSSSCGASCSGHTSYDPSKSSTSKPLNQTFRLGYGDGSSVDGMQYTDTVTIAGLNAKEQTIGAAGNYSKGFEKDRFPADGLMGMGFQSISNYNAPPLFQSLVASGNCPSSVFAFKLSPSGAELSLCGLNHDLYNGEVTYTNVTQEGYWQVDMDALSVGSTSPVKDVRAIVDSGTTLIVGDPKSVQTFYAAIPGAEPAGDTFGAGYYTFPCNATPGAVSLSFGGREFGVSRDAMNIGTVEEGSDRCVGGVVGQDLGVPFWIVGDVFMQGVYTVFDYGKKRVGFAELA